MHELVYDWENIFIDFVNRVFQNEEVIENVTIPTVALNATNELAEQSVRCEQVAEVSKCRFFAGDWSTLYDALRCDIDTALPARSK